MLAQGVARVHASPDVLQAAMRRLLDAWRDPALAHWRPALERLVELGAFDELVDAFYCVLPFGTGGRRGTVGVGPNRFNGETLRGTVAAHAGLLKALHAQPSVVLAYDVRRFDDVRGVFGGRVPSLLRGLSSRGFAEMAAGVYAASGVRAYLLDEAEGRFQSTPELSFAIRHLGAQGGLNISASHNPPDDNGGKFYNADGGQEVPPADGRLLARVEALERVPRLELAQAVEAGWVRPLPADVLAAYVRAIALQGRSGARRVRVAYSPLHGAGRWSVPPVLRAAGFDVWEEPEQSVPDSLFSTVPGAVANPERAITLERVCAGAREYGCTLALVTDPDADRIGAAVWHRGEWRFLDGQAIAVLVVRRALDGCEDPSRAVVLRTRVTTSLVTRLAAARGARVIDDLLVGFKYIGDAMRRLEAGHDVLGVAGRFLVGVEESHGVLVCPQMRDKDAAGGALLLAELADDLAAEGRTLVDAIEEIQRAHGPVENRLRSVRTDGAGARERLRGVFELLRRQPPDSVGGEAVLRLVDRRLPTDPLGPLLGPTDAAARDVIELHFHDARLTLRPSGTEPKCKLYVEAVGGAAGRRAEALIDAAEAWLGGLLGA